MSTCPRRVCTSRRDGRTAAGPDIIFYAQVPSTGAYRLFLDFQHAGTVRTAAFTAVAGDAPNPATPATAGPAGGQTGGHDTGHTHNLTPTPS